MARRKRRDNTYGPSDLPVLSNEILDNEFLASATQAADQDRMSGAYDEFLFSENGLKQMPYERMVDDRLALAEMSLRDREQRALLQQQNLLTSAEVQVVSAAQTLYAVQEQIEEREGELEEQRSILRGERPGKYGINWPGTAPEQTSIINGFLRLMIPYFVFLLVGLVDLAIIQQSFFHVFSWYESFIFTAPTVGVQLVFPHFIGSRLNLLLHKHPRWKVNLTEALVLLVIWIGFATFLTQLRMVYFQQIDHHMDSTLRLWLFVGNFLMLIGLGSWLLLNAARHNPHETRYARLNWTLARLKKRERKAKQATAEAQAQLPIVEDTLAVVKEAYDAAIESTRVELADAAKSTYRRALVNMTGNVDFSAAYLETTTAKSPGRERTKPTARKTRIASPLTGASSEPPSEGE